MLMLVSYHYKNGPSGGFGDATIKLEKRLSSQEEIEALCRRITEEIKADDVVILNIIYLE